MKKFLLFLFLFVATCYQAQAQTFQGLTTQNDSGVSVISSLTITNSPLAVPSGACLVVTVRTGSATAGNVSVSDSANSGAYTKIGEQVDSVSGRTVGFYVKPSVAVAAGSLTITASVTSATTIALNGLIYTGASATCAADGYIGSTFTTTASPSSGNITTTLTDTLIGAFGFSTGSTATLSSEGSGGFTQRFNDTLGTANKQHLHTADAVTTGKGTFAYAPTLSAATSGVIAVMALAPPSSGPPPPPPVTCPVAPCAAGPLTQSGTNTRYWVRPDTGKAIFLAGDYSWDLLTDYGQNGSPTAINFNSFVTFAQSHGFNSATLWKKDFPVLYGWQEGLNWTIGPFPWNRPGPGTASDGLPKWDLTSYNTTFDNLIYNRCLALYQANIYCVVLLFDAADTTFTRGPADGGPFTSGNNINGLSDGYTNSGGIGTGQFTMSAANAVSNAEDAWVQHIVGILNPLPNVIYELSEEQPGTSFSGSPGYGGASSLTFWAPHEKSIINTAEASLALKHPVGIGSMNINDVNDPALYSSSMDWIEPTINSNFSNQFPANVSTNNQGKVVVNDSDHSQDAATLLNSDGTVNDVQDRKYIWENVTSGAAGVFFLDPYLISLTSTTPVRNTCGGTISNGICTTVDTKWDNFRNALGYTLKVTSQVDMSTMTPQPALASTGFALVGTANAIVYAPNGGTFTVNLSSMSGTISVQWLNPASGAISTASNITGGVSSQSFTTPFSGDSVLLLIVTTPASGIPNTLGWYQIPNTMMQPVCPPNNYGNSGYNFSDNCPSVISAWGGAAADTKRNRLIVWGGGHHDYSGNEVYDLDLNTLTFNRLTNPSVPVATACVEAMPDGNPDSRHTYDGLAYIPTADVMTAMSGYLAPSGCASFATWSLTMSTLKWTLLSPSGTGPTFNLGVLATGYDPNTNLLFVSDESSGQFGTYNYATDTFATLNTNATTDYHETGIVDPSRKLFFIFGNGQAWKIDISGNDPAYTLRAINATGCGFVAPPYPGVAYDSVQKLVVGWAGGNTVYLYNGTTDSCTSVTYPNGPPAQQANGTFKRFSYFPNLNVFALVNDASQNAFALRLTPASTGAFAARCAGAGVVECDAMDTTADTTPFFGNSTGGTGTGVLDTTVAPAGDGTMGSAKFTVPANQTSSDLAGNWNKQWGTGFGQNSDFYVQYRFRMDPTFAAYNWDPGFVGGHKFSIFHYNTDSCDQVEITTQDQFQRGYPQMYSDCGQNNFNIDLNNGDFLYEQGNPIDGQTNTNTKYNCHRNFSSPSECAVVEFPWTSNLASNQWMTFYYHIHVGSWGSSNSSVNAWFAYEGGAMIPFVNYNNFVLNCDETPNCGSSPDQFNHVTLTIYDTNHSFSGNPQASVWYCCFIVSTQPIPAPNGGSPPTQLMPPTLAPVSGTYTTPTTVTVTPVSGSTACVTTDGSAPTTNGNGICTHGTAYVTMTSFSQALPATVQAVSTELNFSDSGIVSIALQTTANAPTFMPGAGSFASPQAVALSTTLGSIICYNFTGSPAINVTGIATCTNGTQYTSPIPISTTTTIFAVAGGVGFANSSVSTAQYIILPPSLPGAPALGVISVQ